METKITIENHPTMLAVLKDSYGGIMYNVANRGKYENVKNLLDRWDALTPAERESYNGIIKGAINFLKGN